MWQSWPSTHPSGKIPTANSPPFSNICPRFAKWDVPFISVEWVPPPWMRGYRVALWPFCLPNYCKLYIQAPLKHFALVLWRIWVVIDNCHNTNLASFPGPHPASHRLQYRYCSDERLGEGLGTRLTPTYFWVQCLKTTAHESTWHCYLYYVRCVLGMSGIILYSQTLLVRVSGYTRLIQAFDVYSTNWVDQLIDLQHDVSRSTTWLHAILCVRVLEKLLVNDSCLVLRPHVQLCSQAPRPDYHRWKGGAGTL